MWGKATIAARVKKVIEQRVRDAQKEHDERCAELDEQLELVVKEATEKRETAEEEHAEEMVNKIIGKN